MSSYDIFAIAVIVVLAISAIAAAAVVGGLPGYIVRERKHHHAEAVGVARWVAPVQTARSELACQSKTPWAAASTANRRRVSLSRKAISAHLRCVVSNVTPNRRLFLAMACALSRSAG